MPRTTHVLMKNGTPVVVSSKTDKLHAQAEREARMDNAGAPTSWSTDRERLFVQLLDGRKRFTGYEVKEAVIA